MRPETAALARQIANLIKQGKTNPEIAQELGVSRARIALISQRELGGNPNYMIRKTKHAHLRGDLLAFYMAHTAQETMEYFGLTASEFKSCLSVAYGMKEFALLRKDTRTKEKWSGSEVATMLRYAGILRRNKIAKIINRGNARTVKEKCLALNVSTRNINGVNLTQFRNMFGFEPKYQIRGEAGPGSTARNRFVIIPWAYVAKCYERVNHDKTLLKIFEAYAMFQRFIWGGNPWRKMMMDNRVNKFLFRVGQ
jgi:hypothetical protein